MKTNLNYTEIIERYFDTDLDNDEREWFENELKTNPSFESDYKLLNEINNALAEKDIIVLRKQLDNAHKAVAGPKVISIFRRKVYYYAAAASLAIMIALGSLYYVAFMNKTSYTSDQLYSMFYSRDKAVMEVRSTSLSDADKNLIKALQAYEAKDYKTALTLFSDLKDRMVVKYFTGLSYMEIGNYKEAVKSFENIINQNDNLFLDQSEWYLGLCWIKLNEKEKAKATFTKISTSNSFYKNAAKDVIEKLD